MIKHPIGRLLRPVRAGIDKIAAHRPAARDAPALITLTSTAFADGTPIPQRHAGKGVGDDISPPLKWAGVPASTVELVLIVEDPDVPLPRPIVHCLVTGIDPQVNELPEGVLNLERGQVSNDLPFHIGVGAFKRRGYAGPRPIPGHGPHRYVFQIFALDTTSGLRGDATLAKTLLAINGHVIARGELTGTYERS
ncbi:YbhB/YbcL family Raf kinase inhibitor-like protein [Nocardia sp. NPDC060256]|uniref:YbhB/YbcL family Raf kinase inhibitor-like protein n=1 Tax=unclassified Nocardia TaxID=2637762 RepID=UPI00365AA12E